MIYNACWVWVKKRISIQKEKKFLVSISHVCTKFENETLTHFFYPHSIYFVVGNLMVLTVSCCLACEYQHWKM